jgi:transcriptional regulator GlxA family with amidase domain
MSARRTKQELAAAQKKRLEQARQLLNSTDVDTSKVAVSHDATPGPTSQNQKKHKIKRLFNQSFGYSLSLVKRDLLRTAWVTAAVTLVLSLAIILK